MQPQSSSPYSQAPATCPYPEPTPSSPHNPFPLSEDTSQYYPHIYVLVSPMVSFPQVSPPKPCSQLSLPPYVPQLSISSPNLCNPKFHYCMNMGPLYVLIMSQMNPVHNFSVHFLKIHINIIPPSKLSYYQVISFLQFLLSTFRTTLPCVL